jgi:glutamate/tyrosine decarboxylase-like PLP-dependent enzyme
MAALNDYQDDSVTPQKADHVQLIEDLFHQFLLAQNAALSPQIVDIATKDEMAHMRNATIPRAEGAPMDQVISEMVKIMSHRVSMEHPKFFGLIPSPTNENSYLGNIITSMFNVGTGSWYQGSGPSTVEDTLIKWMAEQAGFPPSAGGVFVSGGTMANLTGVVTARDAMLKYEDRPKAVIYASKETHVSVTKGLTVAGFLRSQIHRVESDSDDFHIDPASLRRQIAIDRKNGLVPFLIAGSCGFTNTGGVDDLNALADIAEEENLWLHVDGAYGASVILSKDHKHIASGISRANSLSWDPHKWLFQIYDCGLILVRDKRHLVESFNTEASYIRDTEEVNTDMVNFWNRGIEMSRSARGLKLWFTLQILGLDKMGEMIDHGIYLAEFGEQAFRELSNWEILSKASLGMFNFRYVPKLDNLDPSLDFEKCCDDINATISRLAMERNVAGLTTTRLRKEVNLRMCTISPELNREQLFEVIQSLDHIAKEVTASFLKEQASKL